MHLLGVRHHRASLPQLINRLNATVTFKLAIRVKRGRLHFKEGIQRGWKPEVLRHHLETLIPMPLVLALLLATLASKT